MGKLKILVTGAAGFLGSHLCEKLLNLHHKVIGIDNMIGGDRDNLPKNLEFHKLDCCDFQKLNKVKTVPYKNNYGYFFTSGPNTWHGMEKKEIKKERRCLQINYVTFKTDWPVD